jgi:hypothetical protein
MLEHMGKTRSLTGVVYRTHIDVSVESHHWRFMSFENNEVQAIRQSKFSNFLLKIRKRLAEQGSGKECRGKRGACESLHI